MSPLPNLRLPLRRLARRHLPSLAAAVRLDAATWTPAPLTRVTPASADESLFHVSVDVSDAPDLAASYNAAGQYLQLRVASADAKPTFLAIASPPSVAADRGVFEFLVKRVPGSTAESLCGLRGGDVVEIGAVMGRGFEVDRIWPPEKFSTVLIFATGSGIRSRALGFNILKDLNNQHMAWDLQGVDHQPEGLQSRMLQTSQPVKG